MSDRIVKLMKKQNKEQHKFNYLNIILKFLSLILFTFLVSSLITNWRVLMLPSSERILQTIDLSRDDVVLENFSLENDALRMTEKNGSVTINTNNNYVEKFKYTYVIKSNVDLEILLTEINSYGNPFENSSPDRLLTDIDLSAFSIRNNVNSIELKFEGEELLIRDLSIDNRIKFNPYIFLATLLTGLIIFIFLFYKEKLLKKVENIFLLVALTSGILFIFLLPNRLGLSWDDETHFLNIYRLSQGGEVKWTNSPLHLVEKIVTNSFIFFDTPEERIKSNHFLNINHNSSDIIISEENHVSWDYKKLTYLPMVISFKISDLIGFPFTISLLSSRLTNLFLYITIIYFAIKNIPICKRLLAFIALLPGSMFLATQFSYDPPITAFFFLAIAMIIKMALSKNTISIRDLLTFVLSVGVASSPKGLYALLILSPLFLSENNFLNKKQKKKIAFVLILIFILIICSFLIPMLLGTASSGDPRGGDTSTLRQFSLFLNQPISFLKIFSKNISGNFFYKFVGIETIAHFAYIGIVDSLNLYYLALLSLSFFTFTDNYGQNTDRYISTKLKIVLITIMLGIISLIWLFLYLDFTPVGSTIINGVQGRYFIPLLPLFLFLFNSYKVKTGISERMYNFILLITSATILLGSIFTMILKHYCF